MRLSTQQFFQLSSASLSDLNSQAAKIQEQISTGRRVTAARDDPGSASRIVRLESQLASIDQFQQNIGYADSRLVRTEQALTDAQDVMLEIQTAIVAAGNPLEAGQREALAATIAEFADELLNIANRRDEQGDYIFSGFLTEQAAYVQQGDGNIVFQGNSGVRRLEIDNGSFVAVSESGADIFEDIPISYSKVETSAAAGNSVGFQVLSSNVVNRATFDAAYPEDYVVTFGAETNIVPNGPNYTVTRVSDGAVIASDTPYTQSSGITFEGLQILGSGTDPQPGDVFNVGSVTEQNLLQIVNDFAAELPGLDQAAERDSFIAGAIRAIESIEDQLGAAVTRVGVSLTGLDTTRNTLADRELAQQSLLSEIRDLDYAEAISNLSLLTFTLEASQASFARISSLSLFNFIR